MPTSEAFAWIDDESYFRLAGPLGENLQISFSRLTSH